MTNDTFTLNQFSKSTAKLRTSGTLLLATVSIFLLLVFVSAVDKSGHITPKLPYVTLLKHAAVTLMQRL